MASVIENNRLEVVEQREAAIEPRQKGLRRYGLVLVVYLLASLFTSAYFMGDTPGYVVSILAYEGVPRYAAENPVVRDYSSQNPFWEFGHLFWRPLGYLLFNTFEPLSRLIVGSDPALNVVFLLVAVNWLAGLLSVFCLHAIALKISGRLWAANVATIAFIFSQAVLSYLKTGAPYVAGLSLLLLGLYFLIRSEDKPARSRLYAIFAGLSLAGSVCLWLPYVCAIPAALVSPLFLFANDARRRRIVLEAAAACALAGGLSYGIVMASLSINTPAELQAWMSTAAHGIQTHGVMRAVFGLPRLMINMDSDGMLIKRFLLHDPFNTVTALDLMRFSLWKLGLFYLFAASVLLALWREARGRRILALLAVNAIFVFAFAVMFVGSTVERYMPLSPLIFLSLAYALGSKRQPTWLKLIPVVFIVVMSVMNLSALATPVVKRRQEASAARVEGLLPLLKPESRIVTSHWQEELMNFHASFPFHPVNRNDKFRLYSLTTPGTVQVEKWREDFAARALLAWSKGGDIWVSERVLKPAPQAGWNWVEGDDRRVSWRDLNSFISQMEMGDSLGGEDGFRLLLPSPANKQLLSGLAPQQESSDTMGGSVEKTTGSLR